MRGISAVAALTLLLAACSSAPPAHLSSTFAAGEKAPVDKLTYGVVDTQFLTRLGEEPNFRTPQNRFCVVQVTVSNAGNQDAIIPAMTLVDDSGKTYDELTDGGGVARWLGVIRRVGPNQTDVGEVVFDAPAAHYKLRLTDETSANEVYIDLPLSFANEQLSHGAEDTSQAVVPLPAPATPAPAAPKSTPGPQKK